MGFWDSISDGFSDVGNDISSGVTTAADTVAGGVTTAADTVAGGVTTAADTVANVAKTGAGDVANVAKNTVLKTGMDILGKVFSLLGLGGKQDPSSPSSDDTSYAYIILAVGGAFAVLLILMLLELFL